METSEEALPLISGGFHSQRLRKETWRESKDTFMTVLPCTWVQYGCSSYSTQYWVLSTGYSVLGFENIGYTLPVWGT